MTGLYLFTAAVGVPLVAFFLLSGGDDGGDGGADDGGSGGGDGVGALMLRALPLSSIAIAAAAFGITGLALGATGSSASFTLIAALAMAALGAVLNSALFGYVRRSTSTSGVPDAQLGGSIGRVILAVGPGRRGRISLAANGQQIYLSAELSPTDEQTLAAGDRVLVVEVRDGLATVTALDPELT